MFNPNPLPSNRPRRDNRQPQNHSERARTFLFNQFPIVLIFIALSLLGLLVQVMPYILAGIYTFLTSFSLVVWTTFDFAFGARAVSEFPPLMWMVWGAVLGACMAFWLSAPLYGWRSKRALILLLPLLLMVIVATFINLKIPLPPQQELLDTATPASTTPASTVAPILPGSIAPTSPSPLFPGA